MANNHVNEELIEKYKSFLNSKRGIFTTQTRGNLLGISVKGRKVRSKTYDFRFDVRSSVKNALKDLVLFIETAKDDDVNEVLNCESLKPVVQALLSKPIKDGAEPNLVRAEIAQLFIEAGYGYLMSMKRKELLSSGSERTIQEAIDHAKLLTASFKSEKDWTL